MPKTIDFIQWEHPDQRFRIRFSASKGLLNIEGMAFEDEELISMLRTAFETVQSSISSSYSERLDIHFYAVSYADPVIIQTINEWVLKNRSASSLRCLWFYDTLTEKPMVKNGPVSWESNLLLWMQNPIQSIDNAYNNSTIRP